MRSWFSAKRSDRTLLGGALALGCALWGGVAVAEELPPPPVVPVSPATVQSTTTTTVTTQAAPVAPVAPIAPVAPVAPVMAAPPYQGLPPGVQGPMYYNGPVWVIPAPVTAQPVAPWLPSLPPPPLVRQQPFPVRTASCCSVPVRYVPQRGPVFGLGVRFTAMGINQQVFDNNGEYHDMNMLGGGVFMRLRSQGHFGFETAVDFHRANVGDGTYVRNSYPFTIAPMIYIFRNRPENHFNIFGIAGVGLVADDVTLFDGSPQKRSQQFLEYMGQLGGGVELKFTHLAITADIRMIGLKLDDSGSAGQYYKAPDGTTIDSGPIPGSSFGYKANVGAMVYF